MEKNVEIRNQIKILVKNKKKRYNLLNVCLKKYFDFINRENVVGGNILSKSKERHQTYKTNVILR